MSTHEYHEHHAHCSHHNHEHDHECHDHEHHHSCDNRIIVGSGYVDANTHDEASVISAVGVIKGDPEVAKAKMHTCLEELGKWVEDSGGVIGHIKCSLETKAITTMSITSDIVDVANSFEPSTQLTMAAIVYCISPQELQKHVVIQLKPLI